MSFISDLQQKRANYNCVEQARTQAKSLNLLSSGIYTEEERFIYELLQNAIDSFQDTAEVKLKVNIEVQSNYLVFSHNGRPFSESDVAGLCDVGNGSKEQDVKKIGYKGIGFKSVFMTSTQVFVSSENYTFKFDKEDSVSYMPEHLKPISSDDVPWQIIPIETIFPSVDVDWDEVNVAICIKLQSSKSIIPRIKDLLSQVDFLLFLNAPHIEIAFTCDTLPKLTVEKGTRDELVELSLDGNIESQWLLHTASVPVGEDVREYIKQNPTSIPDKLKGRKETEVSFAVRVEDDEILRLRDTVVYTYLPTSYALLDMPFLINANFITDASRQQLQSDSVWNQNLLRYIPKLYLKWMARIAQDYRESYFNALPRIKSNNSGLVGIFYTALKEALKKVAFLPSLDDESRVLKASDAFIDKLNLADIIGIRAFIEHINRKYNKKLRVYSRISVSSLDIVKDYGIFIFDWEGLDSLFQDEIFVSEINPQMNYVLLALFCKKYNDGDNFEQMKIIDSLKDLKCLMTSDGVLVEIHNCSLPPNENILNIPIHEMNIIHPDVCDLLKKDARTLFWLKNKFELSEFSKMRFVELILKRAYEITEENAIEVGRLLFRINKENPFLNDSEYSDQIQKLSFLTKQENLKPIVALYLGGQYNPKHNIEIIAPEEDIYISEEYVEDWSDELNVLEWAVFFKKCGASDSVGLTHRVLKASINKKPNVEFMNYAILKEAGSRFRNIKHRFTGRGGFVNPVEKIEVRFQYFTLVSVQNINKQIDKFVFNEVLSKPYPKELLETIYGEVHYWSDRKHPDAYIEHSLSDYIPNEYRRYKSFFEYLISEVQQFPTTMEDFLPSEEVYLNTENIRSLAGSYLPVLDIANPVHESWLDILLFKKELYLDDLLELLSCISQDKNKDQARENKERVEEIYRKILEQDLHISGRDKIAKWGKKHRILSSKDGEFYRPSELSYVTVEGFSPENTAFIGKLREDKSDAIVRLLTTLGVRVIMEITPVFEGKSEDNALKKLLKSKIPYLALLKISSGFRGDFAKTTFVLEGLIDSFACYRCSDISLSYGDEDDIIKKRAYCEGPNFYYTGKLSIPCLDGLVSGLANELKLRNKYVKEVLVILSTNDHEELLDYLCEKGYDVSLLPQNVEQVSEAEITAVSTNPTELSKKERIEAQLEAQRVLMDAYPDWQFPEGYGEGAYLSVVRDIKDEQGNAMVIVLKSYRDDSKPLKITAEECEALLKEKAKLCLCTYENYGLAIQERDFISLIGGQECITISFDASNLTGKQDIDKIQKFVELLRYFSGLHIAIEQYNLSAINLYTRKEGEQIETTDDDL